MKYLHKSIEELRECAKEARDNLVIQEIISAADRGFTSIIIPYFGESTSTSLYNTISDELTAHLIESGFEVDLNEKVIRW